MARISHPNCGQIKFKELCQREKDTSMVTNKDCSRDCGLDLQTNVPLTAEYPKHTELHTGTQAVAGWGRVPF